MTTSPVVGVMILVELGGEAHVAQLPGRACGPLSAMLAKLADACGSNTAEATLECETELTEDGQLLVVADSSDLGCIDVAQGLSIAVHRYRRMSDESELLFGCSPTGLLKDISDDGSGVTGLNAAIELFQEHEFAGCKLTTVTTTATSTPSSTATFSATTSGTSSGTTTPDQVRLECHSFGGTHYVTVESSESCNVQAAQLNGMVSTCSSNAVCTDRASRSWS